MGKDLLWSTRPLPFKYRMQFCKTGIFQTKLIQWDASGYDVSVIGFFLNTSAILMTKFVKEKQAYINNSFHMIYLG